MASRQQQFMEQAYWNAREAGLPDVQARLAASQAALETGFGKSVAGNNYFGIKAGSSWNGPTVNVGTWEEVNGRPQSQRANFRAYDNPFQSFTDWAETVGRRWGDAMKAPTLVEAIDALGAGKKGGYATDSKYGSKLNSINARFDPNPLGLASRTDVPVPTAKPDLQFTNAAAQSVQRAPIQEVAADLARPDTPFSRATSVSSPMANNPFDWGRMAAPTTTPSALTSFNTDRFGTASPVAQGMTGLKAAMSPSLAPDTPLARANFPNYSPEELLALDVAEANPGRAAAQAAKSASYQAAQAAQAPKTYVDPTVTTAYAQQPAAGNTGSRAIDRQTTGAVGQKIGPDQATLDAAAKSAQLNDRLSQMQSKQMTGTVLGGLLGTAIAGPLGGILGVGLGNKWAGRTGEDYFPSAPSLGGRLAQLFGFDAGNGGMSGLTTNRLADVAAQYGINLSDADRAIYGDKSGRDMAMESGQLQNAVNSGKSGLW